MHFFCEDEKMKYINTQQSVSIAQDVLKKTTKVYKQIPCVHALMDFFEFCCWW